jgi:Tol biopolymer transport system component
MRTGRVLLTTIAAAFLIAPLLTVSAPVKAAFPGVNGRILFTSTRNADQFDLHTMTPAGGSVINISNTPDSSDEYATYSPNGKKVAVTTSRDGNYEIYVMNADGSGATRLTNDPGTDATPAWSPNGKRIIFTSNRDGDFEIYTVNRQGADIKQLTSNTATDTNQMLDAFPSYSPNGTKIVFASQRDGNLEIYTMNANGSSQANISTDVGDDLLPTWSPDGKKIAFASTRDGDGEIFVMNANGAGVSQLTVNNPAADTLPIWSPQGNKIAFASDRDDLVNNNPDVFVMSPNGGNVVNLTETPDSRDIPFDWQATPANRSLSISRSRAQVDRGDRVRLFGELDGVASCIGNQKIQLQSRSAGGGRFSNIGSTRTDSDGDYEFQKRVTASKQFRSVAPAFGQCKKATSATTSVSVQGSSAPPFSRTSAANSQSRHGNACGLALEDLLAVLGCGSRETSK